MRSVNWDGIGSLLLGAQDGHDDGEGVAGCGSDR